MTRTQNPEAIREAVKRIRPVNEVDPYVKVLVFGPNGSGKTRFAGTAPNCLIVDINERGTRSIVGTGAQRIEIDRWDDIGHIYWYLKSGKHDFESVAIDTVTAMQGLAMSFVLGEAEERDPSRERGMPDKRSYGRAGELVKGIALAFRNLDMHVIFTAQVRNIYDDVTDEITEQAVDLPAGSRGTVTGCVSVLGFMQPKEVRVRRKDTGKIESKWVDQLILGPDSRYGAVKDRTNRLGPVMRNPTMPDIIEAWNRTEGN